jgi:hypothetical protein
MLNKITGGNLDSQIVVMADEQVPYRDLVSALDQVRLASYHRIALAATPKQRTIGRGDPATLRSREAPSLRSTSPRSPE